MIRQDAPVCAIGESPTKAYSFFPSSTLLGFSNPPLSANLTSRNCDGGIFSATRRLCVNLLAHDRPWAERQSGFCQLSLRSSRRPSQIRMRPENVYRYLFWPQWRIERLNERTRSFESSIGGLEKQHLEGSGNLRVLRIKAYVVQRDRRAEMRILDRLSQDCADVRPSANCAVRSEEEEPGRLNRPPRATRTIANARIPMQQRRRGIPPWRSQETEVPRHRRLTSPTTSSKQEAAHQTKGATTRRDAAVQNRSTASLPLQGRGALAARRGTRFCPAKTGIRKDR